MIRPRPTTYYQAIRDYASDKSPVTLRPIAHCSICGARLSRYRFPGETRCAPCIQKHTATLTADELHPQLSIAQLNRNIVPCPSCGAPKDRKARLCRKCRYDSKGDEAA